MANLLTILCDTVMFSCVFCHFPMWFPGSGVVLDYIESLSFSPSLIGICSQTARFHTCMGLTFNSNVKTGNGCITFDAPLSKIQETFVL